MKLVKSVRVSSRRALRRAHVASGNDAGFAFRPHKTNPLVNGWESDVQSVRTSSASEV